MSTSQLSKFLHKLILNVKSIAIVDLVGISFFFIIVVLSAFFFLRSADYVTVLLRVSESDSINIWARPASWYVSELKPGLTEKDGLGRDVLTVTEVETYQTSEENKTAYLQLKLRAVYNKRTNQYLYNGVPLLIGSYQTFKLQGVQLMGVIHQVGEEIEQSEKKKYLVKGYIDSTSTEKDALAANSFTEGISLFRAEKFREGLEIINSKGYPIAKVISVEKSPAYRMFPYDSTYFKALDRDKQVVNLEVEIIVEKNGEQFMFKKEQVVKVGRLIYLDFPEADAPLVVTSFEEVR